MSIATAGRVRRILLQPNPAYRDRLNSSLQLKKPATLIQTFGTGEHIGWTIAVPPQFKADKPMPTTGFSLPKGGIPGRTVLAREVLRKEALWYRQYTTKDLHDNYKGSMRRRLASNMIPPTSTKVASLPPIASSVSGPFILGAAPSATKPVTSNDFIWAGILAAAFLL